MSFYKDFNPNIAIEKWNTAPRQEYRHLKLNQLSATLGAEIEGLDLSRELSDAQFAEVKRALDENLVIAFRNQALDADAQKRFARRFGRLHKHVLAKQRKVEGGDKDPEILSWRTGRETRSTAGNAWHTDVSCDQHPIIASLLRVTKGPAPGSGDTAFANMYLAYESLSDPFRAFLDGLTAVHDGAQAWTGGYGAKPDPGQVYSRTEHPVVVRHPSTGRKFLYVNEAFTSHIVQLTRPESDAVLALLYRHIEKNLAFQVRVHWQPDTLIVWDNWATQHHAVWDYYPFERFGERVSVYSDLAPTA